MILLRTVGLLVAASLLAIVACDGGTEQDPSPEPSPTRDTAVRTATPAPTPTGPTRGPFTPMPEGGPTPAPTATVVRVPQLSPEGSDRRKIDGGTLVRLGSDPPTLDPQLNTDVTSAEYIVEVFGGLLTFDRDLALIGDLAQDWAVSADGLEFTFRLKPEAVFHDGRQVTSADFQWSIERAADPATEGTTVDVFLGDIVGVKEKLDGAATHVSGVAAVDPQTLVFRIDAPKVYFLSKLSYPISFVLDRNNVEGNDDWIRRPNGTGAFRLVEYEPGEVLRLGRADQHHLGRASLDEVEFILSGGNSMLMYENDEIHVTNVPLVLLEGLRDPTNPLSDQLHVAPARFDVSYFGMNAAEPPFDDPKVRQALNYAVDRDTIADLLFEGLVTPAKGILPPGFPSYNPDLDGYRFDPELARRLLGESKYGADMENFPPITVTLPGSFGASPSTPTIAVMAMWENYLGIRMDILQTEWATYLHDLHRRRFQMFGGIGWVADYLDPQNFLETLFHSESSNNYTHYSNPELDLLLDRAGKEPDTTARAGLYHEAERMVVQDSPWVPLWHSSSGHYLVKPNVHGYSRYPLVIPTYRYVYFTG